MIYTLDQLRDIIAPIAKKYNIPAVYIFGSYARGDATEESDVDVLIENKGSKISTLFELGGLYNDLNEALKKELDIVEEEALDDECRQRMPWFVDAILKERIRIYGKTRYTANPAHAGILRRDRRIH